ncbi:glucosamine-6-phosphate deaminase [Stygiobacter electus]|jgi:glucosamine-6-phosphate deaminase|uniref:Glucosamine-6-phosphate deaminase n=1 Tax=Stygiobacter electus TaxID=3032292 RepID=A0AAE3NVT4_9BACT|nr:glucosamine-6-phosphate deaminase [Stygiobacter electus]MDF1611786.1 glucosamine-6-phosphate deaminase [Stygiobacter electus]
MAKVKIKKTSEKVLKPKSKVEQYYLDLSGKEFIYKPTEKIPIIQVDSFPELGKLTALRFIEWIIENPDGVISLPTGKTPEHFIKWVEKILKEWNTKSIQKLLGEVGIKSDKKPSLENLKFVQIDEFYPIDSGQHNSFYYYIQNFYFRLWGLNPKNAMLMNINEIPTAENVPLKEIFPEQKVDLSLRTRWASSRLERLQKETIEIVDEYCSNYERKIREMGGIGFFLGGIGPDGHIGFNVQGSDHFSTTRLIQTNYETQAAAATDLGGIEVARNRLVITIGLETITYNKDATAIIIAAGEAKANIVRDSIQNSPSIKYPATALQKLLNARFYLTHGAALRLSERRFVDVTKENPLTQQSIERAVINLVVDKHKKLTQLTKDDYKENKITNFILHNHDKNVEEINSEIEQNIISRLDKGMQLVENEVFLHTAPHHDDIELAYQPYVTHLVRTPKNKHHFTYLTSGFTAVTNSFMLELMQNLMSFLNSGTFTKKFNENYFNRANIDGKNRDVMQYLDGVAAHSRTLQNEALARRLLRNIMEVYEEESLIYLKDRVNELINYFKTQYPGKKDIAHVQKLKGMQREFESEIFWGYYGFSVEDVSHLRLGFYQGDIFTELPEIDRDVYPILELLKKVKPTIVTVAFDPEGSGPDTHYKVMQAVSEALQLYEKETGNSNIKVWGYRNVWYRFHPAEANIYVPVSLNSFAMLENQFIKSFSSQKGASFPSWEYDGPFNRLVQKIQVEQYNTLRECLGKDFFLKNNHPRLRAAKGILFLRELSLDEFYKHTRELKKVTE